MGTVCSFLPGEERLTQQQQAGSECDPTKPGLGEIQGYQELEVFSILELGCTALAYAQQKKTNKPLQQSRLPTKKLAESFCPPAKNLHPNPAGCSAPTPNLREAHR